MLDHPSIVLSSDFRPDWSLLISCMREVLVKNTLEMSWKKRKCKAPDYESHLDWQKLITATSNKSRIGQKRTGIKAVKPTINPRWSQLTGVRHPFVFVHWRPLNIQRLKSLCAMGLYNDHSVMFVLIIWYMFTEASWALPVLVGAPYRHCNTPSVP